MNDYEAHLSSYDHSHKQRLKDMKAMVRDPNAAARARKAEAKADGVISIKIGEGGPGAGGAAPGGGAGFKKGGFKKSGFKSAFVAVDGDDAEVVAPGPEKKEARIRDELRDKEIPVVHSSLVESDTEDEGYEVYDPRYPTD